MKAVILAGGLGTRISEESICCGYKGYMIKEYFANYFLHMSDVTFDLSSNAMEVHNRSAEPWRVTLVDTGELTQTGGRIRRIADHLDGTFCLTYGDGVSDVDISALIAFHRAEGCSATVTAIQPAGRFGALGIDGTRVTSFREKPQGDGQWVNGGFFVCEPSVLDRIEGDQTVFEQGPLESLAADREIALWQHDGFWQSMDTLRDKTYLEELWQAGRAPWRTWDA
jgi:glucose-1-phosphate cytidylyltransferase